MPRIIPYEQRTSAAAPLGPDPVARPFGQGGVTSAVGSALGSIVDDRNTLRVFEKQKAEERAAVLAHEEVTNTRSRWIEELQRRQEEAPEDGAGFAVATLKDFDADGEERIKRMPTQASRDWLKQRLADVRLGMQADTMAFEAQRGAEYKVNGLTRSVDQARIAAEFRPEEFATLAQEQRAAIEASGLNAAARVKLSQDAVTKLADASVRGMIRSDPHAALKEINDETTASLPVRALSFEQRLMMRNAATAEINRREAESKANLTEVRQALNDQLTDIKVAATNGMTITNVPSRTALVAAFGEQEGNQRYGQALAFADLSPKVTALYQAPAGEIVETVQSFKPTQVEGAADQFAMLGVMQQKAAAILKEREADAGGYLATYSPSVRRAWSALQEAPADASEEATSAYLRSVRAEKERLGIQSQDVLPAAYADALVDRLTRPQGAEQLSTAMASESERWGAAWPEVYRQMQKKLPDAALVIGSGIPKRAADTLALMSSKSNDELKALVPAGHSMNDIEKDVTEDLADLVSTFGPEGATVLNAVHNSTVKTAIGYMATGSSYRDAITKAANDIANERYSFQAFRSQAYRVPVEIDADLVDEGATFFLESYAQPSGTVQVPAGTPEEIILGQASDHIRRKGYWRTAPDESGLRLYVGNAVVPGVGGKPVQLSWQQLDDLAQQSATERFKRTQQEAERRMRAR